MSHYHQVVEGQRPEDHTLMAQLSKDGSDLELAAPAHKPHSISYVPRRFSSSYATPHLRQLPSEDSRVLGSPSPSPSISRGSMILYRLTDFDELAPPKMPLNRKSSAGDSVISISSDSKYPSAANALARGFVPYAYNPLDDIAPDNEEDAIHDPRSLDVSSKGLHWRGLVNIGMLLLILGAIITLFVAYPIVTDFHDNGRAARIVGNTRINKTGQAVDENAPVGTRSQIPIDLSSPLYRLGPGEFIYELAFADEFNDDGRDFASDPIWKPMQHPVTGVTTRNGALLLTQVLGIKRPLCVHHGFLEVGIRRTLDGPVTRLFWSGEWYTAGLHDQAPPIDTSNAVDVRVTLEGASSNPAELILDYIRLYQQQGDGARPCTFLNHTTLHLTPYLYHLSE